MPGSSRRALPRDTDAGRPLRGAHVAQVSGLHLRGYSDAGAWNRSEHLDFQRGAGSVVVAAALLAPRTPGDGVGEQSAISSRLDFLRKFPGLAARCSLIRRDDGV